VQCASAVDNGTICQATMREIGLKIQPSSHQRLADGEISVRSQAVSQFTKPQAE